MLFRQMLSSQNQQLGSLYAWGWNRYGTLGDNTSDNKSSPVQIGTGIAKWTKISNDQFNSLAIKSDGSMWVWGDNTSGQLGQGYTSPLYISTAIQALTTQPWAQIASGHSFVLGLKQDGSLWAWGSNSSGQLGILSTVNQSSPVLVSGPSNVSWALVAAGQSFAIGLTTTGVLYSWGGNSNGQLGDLSTSDKFSPILVSSPANVSWALVDCGDFHVLALTTSGQLYAWGNNSAGRLGISSTFSTSSPVLVSGPASTSWAAISGGNAHSLAITTSGVLYAWGFNSSGELGDLSVTSRSSPVLVSGPVGTVWSKVAAGQGYSLSISNTGLLYAWGAGITGKLGDLTTTNKSSPVLVSGPVSTSWSAVSALINSSFAISSLGELYSWGQNTSAALGVGSTTDISSPMLVSAPVSVSWNIVSTFGNGAWALTTDNIIWGWGYNYLTGGPGGGGGWLGIPTSVISPIQIGSSSWTVVSTNSRSMFAINTAGELYAWGGNTSGQLGDLSTITRNSPVLVSGPANTSWALITSGSNFALGITNTGQLYGWGANSLGQLGTTNGFSSSSPILVSGPASTSWSFVSAGNLHSLAITSLGVLYAWGEGASGKLGNLSVANANSPVLVSGPAGASWATVSAGTSHSLGVTTLGTLWAWGRSSSGQLGDLQVFSSRSSPILVSGPAGASWISVSAGLDYSAGITTSRVLYTWGLNSFGQLGDLTTVNKSSPVVISGPATSWAIVNAGGNGATKAIPL